MQLPMAYLPTVLVDVTPFLADDGLRFSISIPDSELTWRTTAVVITSNPPTDVELRELGRIIYLGATA